MAVREYRPRKAPAIPARKLPIDVEASYVAIMAALMEKLGLIRRQGPHL